MLATSPSCLLIRPPLNQTCRKIQAMLDPSQWTSPTILAPMAGVTDRDFRLLIRRIGGVGLVTMEFLSSRALVGKHAHTLKLAHFEEEERPISIQIYGSDAATMTEAARMVESMGADICDINMGCPANKVLKGCAGAALMGDLDLAKAIIRSVRTAITIPLTVKFRIGLDNQRATYLELGRICEGEGVDAIALHGRTAKEKFSGSACWDAIRRLKQSVSIPVAGNGDIRAAEDALRMFDQTGCDAVMIGRAATKNPWIFQQIAARLSGGQVADPTLRDRRDLILSHFTRVVEREEPRASLHKLRKFTGWYTHGLPHGRRLRQRINEISNPTEFLDEVHTFFEKVEKIAA